MGTNPSDLIKSIKTENSSVPDSGKEQNQEESTNVVKSVDTQLSKESSQEEKSEQIIEKSIPSTNQILHELDHRSTLNFNKSSSLKTSRKGRTTAKNTALDYEPPTNNNQNRTSIASKNQINETSETEHVTSSATNALSNTKRGLHDTFKIMKLAADVHDTLFIEELKDSVSPLLRALAIRQKYMHHSCQSYSTTIEPFLAKILEEDDHYQRTSLNVNLPKKEESDLPTTVAIKVENPFSKPLLPPMDACVRVEKGIYHVYTLNEQKQWIPAKYKSITMDEFIEDYTLISKMIVDGPLQSYCHRRLQYLKTKHELHTLLNEVKEWSEAKSASHRDFYNIRKVDTHIHAVASMHQKSLLTFMKKKMQVSSDMKVYKKPDGTMLTLKQVFDELKLDINHIDIDQLGVHADRHTFQRFDRFNANYNPAGKAMLREIFMKPNNHIDGVFYAELLKEVITNLEVSRYQHAEFRMSIQGRSMDEWDKLGKWFLKNEMHSTNVSYMIQVPRIFTAHRAGGKLKNFEELLTNLFQPLFDATIHPESHPDLFRFMRYFTGFDSVDDESKPERSISTCHTIDPDQWNTNENPPYAYYLFYMYANILTLNQLRRSRGLNTYQLRPHCGEAGDVSHLATAYILAENISHGLVLHSSSVLQYLYYLCQIGIAMSPLSNNSLFLSYNRNPFLEYFQRGLCVSLSTDDPLQFHFTKEPLMEEYSIAAQIWKLSSIDMCEIARNSVLMSGYPDEVKKAWLGVGYKQPGIAGNDIRRSNVPNIRIGHRYEVLCEELRLLKLAYHSRQEEDTTEDSF
ncbi:unnamed protein product [Rotaria sordida]|uniref:AMP deaminase n=1 Tax=Rotaria sordida TaxID=392033 RepID=A0A819K8G3_9BILA|nr:unnamed protein product [Rotaria sordida]